MTITQSKQVLNLIFFAILMRTMFAWYEISTTFGIGEGGSLPVRVLTISPAIVAIILVLVRGQSSVIPKVWFILVYWAAFTFLMGIIIGMLDSSHSWRYILGDSFRYGISWGSLYAGLVAAVCLARTSQDSLEHYFDSFLVLAIADVIATYWLVSMFPWAKISTSFYLFAIVWGAMYVAKRPYFAITALILGIGATLISGKRGQLITVTLISPGLFFLLATSGWFSIRRFIRVFVVVVILMGTSWVTLQQFPDMRSMVQERSEKLIDNVLEITSNFSGEGRIEDESAEGRIVEMKNIELFFRDNPPLVLFGAGFGAEIPMVYWTGVLSNSGRMHHVHVAWAVYFLRNGINGVFLLVVYFTVCILAIKKYSLPNGRFSVFLATIMFGEFILAFKGNIMLEALPMVPAICVALTVGQNKRHVFPENITQYPLQKKSFENS